MQLSAQWWDNLNQEFQMALVKEFVKQANSGELDLSNYTVESIQVVDFIQDVLIKLSSRNPL